MKIMMLEFKECAEDGDVWWSAESPVGAYEFHAQVHSVELECVRPPCGLCDQHEVFAVCSSPILAIQACQKDFERIVTACILP